MGDQERIKSFEKKMGWDRTDAGPLVLFLKRDAAVLNRENAKHKLVDLYLELLQLANRNKLKLSPALAKHLKEAEKKYKKKK